MVCFDTGYGKTAFLEKFQMLSDRRIARTDLDNAVPLTATSFDRIPYHRFTDSPALRYFIDRHIDEFYGQRLRGQQYVLPDCGPVQFGCETGSALEILGDRFPVFVGKIEQTVRNFVSGPQPFD